MLGQPDLPLALSKRAERQTWFCAVDSLAVLEWLEHNGCRLLGIETARKSADGKWTLLLDPMLDCSRKNNVAVSIDVGRVFIRDYAANDLMFEMAW
jgi:hypothetical protein